MSILVAPTLGQALHDKGLMDEAIAHFQSALQINPNQAELYQPGAAFRDRRYACNGR